MCKLIYRTLNSFLFHCFCCRTLCFFHNRCLYFVYDVVVLDVVNFVHVCGLLLYTYHVAFI